MDLVGRVGLVARGLLYCVLALVALGVATGDRDAQIEGQGALRLLKDQPYGTPLLLALAVGFAAYAAWRLIRAATGAGEGTEREGATGALKRVGDVVTAAVHASLLLATLRVLGGGSGQDGDQQAKSWSAGLLDSGGGRLVVVVAGLVLVGVGIGMVVYALTGRHERHLDESSMRRWQRTWLPRLGTAGHLARAGVAALVGAFLVQAAVSYDADKATGIDGALHRLAGRSYGPLALTLVAIGLLAYGLYSFVEARWRKVLDRPAMAMTASAGPGRANR